MSVEKQPEDLNISDEHTGEEPLKDSDASDEQEQQEEEKDEMTLIQEQLEEALREKDQFRSIAQRAQADLVNYRRRVSEEQQELRRNANANLIMKFLGVADDFNRAMAMIPEDAVAPGWMEGLQLVERNLSHILDSEGVEKIEALGQLFQPWEHEAVLYQENPDAEEGMVTDVIRDGYKLYEKVLRAAQVIVSKAPEPDDSEEQQSSQQEA